jgi:hypothetical protein
MIVFDIDDLLSVNIEISSKVESKVALFIKALEQSFPGSQVFLLSFETERVKRLFLHLIPDGWIQCLKLLISWKWRFAFFSGGLEVRNRAFVSQIETLLDLPNILYFSRGNLMFSKEKNDFFDDHYKKDLVHVGLELENSLLIEDNIAYCVKSQWPNLILPNGEANKVSAFLKSSWQKGKLVKSETKVKSVHFFQFPFYTMGFLHMCKNQMEQDRLSLRKTLIQFIPKLDEPLSNVLINLSMTDKNRWFLTCYQTGKKIGGCSTSGGASSATPPAYLT